MSTRYVWGKYTKETQQVLVDGYKEARTSIGQKRINPWYDDDNNKMFTLYRRISISQSNGTITPTSYTNYYISDYSTNETFGTGYVSVTSGNIYYGTWYKVPANITKSAGAQCDNTYDVTSEYYTYYDYYYVRGSLTGYLSSSNRNDYPSNDYSGSIWYYYQGSDSIDAASVSLPDNIEGGQSCNITITPSSNKKYSGTVTYSVYYRYNGGTWNYLSATTSTNIMLSIPKGTNTVQVRVQAKDDIGFTSTDYTTSETKNVTNGSPPYIQWSYYVDQETDDYILHDVGDITEPFEFQFTPTDPDNDSMTLTETLCELNEDMNISYLYDNKETSDISSGLQRTNTFLTDGDNFLKIALDKKCGVVLRLEDEYDMVSKQYIVTFKKVVDEVTITMKNPMRIDGDISEAVIILYGYFPQDAIITIKATNGANDDEVIWQDVTEDVLAGRTFYFNSVAQKGAAFNFELYAKRGASKESGYIDTIIGAFE